MHKKIGLSLLLFLSLHLVFAQDWITSFDAAKRLAVVQNKMLLVMWEESTYFEYPVRLKANNGDLIFTDLFDDPKITEILWDHFIPVRLPESQYDELFQMIDGKRTANYIEKFNDESIKIMDANGNILNINEPYTEILDLQGFIDRYALNTVFLQPNYYSYREKQDFTTALRLALKLYDFAVINKKIVKKELVYLADIYLKEAQSHLIKVNEIENSERFQKLQLFEIKRDLILDKPKRVRRLLKKINFAQLSEENKALHIFLNYTSLMLLNESIEAMKWQTELSLVDLKKAQLIINSNK